MRDTLCKQLKFFWNPWGDDIVQLIELKYPRRKSERGTDNGGRVFIIPYTNWCTAVRISLNSVTDLTLRNSITSDLREWRFEHKKVNLLPPHLSEYIASSLRKLCFREKKKFEILVSEYSEWSQTSRNIIFSWHPDVCVYMCVCARLSNFQTTMIHKWLDILSWNLVQQWSHSPSIVTIFMQIDAQFGFYGILNFLKNVCGSSNFRKI